jgi:hydroxymethylpyrimidine pyrophosphatase-like HAD family hydrolase
MLKHPLFSDRTLFLTDLDSTLIWSHRHEQPSDCVWVEELNGRQQSFMTAASYRYFLQQKQYAVVPVTTRDQAQYARLQGTFAKFGWHTALICNGAVLLHDGMEDKEWWAESERISAHEVPHLLKLRDAAVNLVGAEAVIYVEPFFLYVRSTEVPNVYERLKAQADPQYLAVYPVAGKVCCVPQSLSKGAAAKRFLAYTGQNGYIAAGDSAFDISLPAEAKIALYPENLREQITESATRHFCRGHFTDEICDYLESLQNRGTRID